MFKYFKKRFQALTFFEIFVSISIIVFTVFVIKFFGQKIEWKTVRIEIINKSWAENYNPYGYRTPFWLSDKLAVGQKEYDKSGKLIAEITNIENYERGSEEADVYLTVKLRTTLQKRLHQYIFKNKPLDLGSAIEIAPNQNIVYGQIVDVNSPELGYPQKTFTVTARSRSLDPQIYNKIVVGEKMYDRYKNLPIATITSVKLEKPSRVYIDEIAYDSSNNSNRPSNFLSFKYNPKSNDIVVKFNIVTSQIDNRWYFAGHQNIKLGNTFYFYGQNISLYNLEIEDVE